MAKPARVSWSVTPTWTQREPEAAMLTRVCQTALGRLVSIGFTQ